MLEVEQRRIPPSLPFVNGVAERAVKSVRLDILNHVRCLDVEELQWYIDEYRIYYGQHRAHQAIDGETPVAFGQDTGKAGVISLDEVRRRRLVRRSFAHGLLNVEPGQAHPERSEEWLSSRMNPQWFEDVTRDGGLRWEHLPDVTHPRGLEVGLLQTK